METPNTILPTPSINTPPCPSVGRLSFEKRFPSGIRAIRRLRRNVCGHREFGVSDYVKREPRVGLVAVEMSEGDSDKPFFEMSRNGTVATLRPSRIIVVDDTSSKGNARVERSRDVSTFTFDDVAKLPLIRN